MKRIFLGLMLFLLLFWLLCSDSFGEELNGKLSEFDYGGINAAFEENTGISVDFKKMAGAAVTDGGEGLWESFKDILVSRLFGDFKSAFKGLRLLLAAAVAGGFIKNLIVSFTDKETGELGFAVSYMLCVGLGLGAFIPLLKILSEFCEGVAELVTAALPLMLSLIAACGNPTGAVCYSSLSAVCCSAVTAGISAYVVPLLNFAAACCAVNYISEEAMLKKLYELLKKTAEWGIKAAAVVFTLGAGLNRMTSSIGNAAVKNGAKAAAGMIPVAGDVIKGAAEGGLAVMESVKSGAGVVFILLICALAIAPVLRVVLTAFAFKLIAGLCEPVCDKRIIEFIDNLGDLSFVVLGVMIVVWYVFVFAAFIFAALGIG